MMGVILLQDVGHPLPDPAHQIEWQGKMIDVPQLLWPFPEGVDPELVTILCAINRADEDARPNLQYLLNKAQGAVANPAESYRDKPEEQDDAISELWRDIVYNAPTSSDESNDSSL